MSWHMLALDVWDRTPSQSVPEPEGSSEALSEAPGVPDKDTVTPPPLPAYPDTSQTETLPPAAPPESEAGGDSQGTPEP